MKYLALIPLFLCLTCRASDEQAALQSAAQAFYKMPEVKERAEVLERKIVNKLPFDKDVAVFTGGIAATLIQGRISTKHIKNIELSILGGDLRTHFEYNFTNGSAESYLNWNLRVN